MLPNFTPNLLFAMKLLVLVARGAVHGLSPFEIGYFMPLGKIFVA